MRVLIQRVKSAGVNVDGCVVGKIGKGIVLFVGIARDDDERDIDYVVNKVINLRIFSDEQDRFNLSLIDIGGEILVISQFTLMGDARKGRRPSFTDAAPPEAAESLFNRFVNKLQTSKLKIETGVFRKHMVVEILNDGPVTLSIDSASKGNSK